MCGIAGIFDPKGGSEISENTMERMISLIEHRGPDEFGIYIDKNVGFGHARLSIIDLETGQQPMSNEDGSVWITFNGEIFNYLELKESLIDKGHVFSTSSDTEVIVHLYEDHGVECLKFLNGQFAFAIWDKRKKEIFAARDRLGIRPLFYTKHGGRIYFASEIKSIFACEEIIREIDPVALDEIFTLWHTVPPRTTFKGINELSPGHFIVIDRHGELNTRRYWDIEFPEKVDDIDIEEASENLKELLIDSTRLRLRADVPVGAYLSGGLDSSIITALIRNFTSSELQTFSVAFKDSIYDESFYQKEMAGALGTKHNEIRVSYDDIALCFPDVIWHTEKPILRTAPAPLYMLSKYVRDNGLKVVLTGEGADEVAGGYDIFKETKIRLFWSRFPDSKYRPLLLKKLYPYLPAFQGQSKTYRESFFNEGITNTSDNFFSHRPRWGTTSKTKLFFSDLLKEKLSGSVIENSILGIIPNDFSCWHPMAKAQYLETKGLLPGYILSSQGDRVAMANSVEGRFPFLDHRVAEFLARVPFHFKIKCLNEKYILKKFMKQHLPKNIVKRAKQPYMAPDSKSFFSDGKSLDYVEYLLSESQINKYGYFNSKAVKFLEKKCKKGGAVGFRDNMALTGILSTQILHQRFIKNFDVKRSHNKVRLAQRPVGHNL